MKKGFTLVELLVTISIVGILSSMSMAQFKHVKFKAERAKEIAELRQKITQVQLQRVEMKNGVQSTDTLEDMMEIEMELVSDAIVLARKSTNQTLRAINNNTNSSDARCRSRLGDPSRTYKFGTSADTVEGSRQYDCIKAWENVYTLISNAASVDLSFLKTDPWGSPYLIDENEGEFGPNPCREDDIFSAGPDKIHTMTYAVNPQEATGDGYELQVPNLNDYSVSHPVNCTPLP